MTACAMRACASSALVVASFLRLKDATTNEPLAGFRAQAPVEKFAAGLLEDFEYGCRHDGLLLWGKFSVEFLALLGAVLGGARGTGCLVGLQGGAALASALLEKVAVAADARAHGGAGVAHVRDRAAAHARSPRLTVGATMPALVVYLVRAGTVELAVDAQLGHGRVLQMVMRVTRRVKITPAKKPT